MNTRTTGIVASLALLGSLALTSCANGDDGATEEAPTDDAGAATAESTEPITLRVMSTTVVGAPEGPLEERIADDFMAENPNITIEFVGVAYNEYATKLTTIATGGDVPDVFANGPELYTRVNDLGIAADLGPLLGQDFLDGFAANILDESYIDDVLQYAPYYSIPQALIYRQDLFDAAGLEAPTTWDEFVDAAKTLTVDADADGTTDQWGFAMVGTANGSGGSRFVPVLRTFGAQEMVQASDGTWASGIDSEGGIAALQLYGDLVNTHGVVPPGVLQTGYPEAVNLMSSGQTAMMVSGSNAIGAILAQAPDLEGKLASAPLPAGPDGETVTVLGQLGWSIAETSEHKEAAAEYIKFFLSKQNQIDWALTTGRLPVRSDATGDAAFETPQYAGFIAAMENSIQLPPVPYYPNVQLMAAEAYQAVISGTPAEQAAADAATKIDQEIANNG
ncbi:sugar ABC transporter substrate-binding protein [Cellulomonas sp. KRMCY2]|uniref:ABC transporter substrate-binding protein n=1 Tax=Cellulomonas sp. KRMCY2 TaxID=1304865 RepID=UPI00045EC6DB|nr:sugar ABC transporter substrate-binding protein [Cellulomonas sp. KRMCY2]